MRMYSTGETARLLGVTRDSLHAALRTTAPDATNRIGNRRVFTEDEVERLAEWFERRRKLRDCPWEVETPMPNSPGERRERKFVVGNANKDF